MTDYFHFDEEERGIITYTVGSADTDAFYRTRLSLYQTLVQEAAGVHAGKRGVGIPDLVKKGVTWVIARSRMEIYSYGKWLDELTIKTWPLDAKGLKCPRIVECYGPDGSLAFKADTDWAIVDIEKKRPVRPTEEFINTIKPPRKELQGECTFPNLMQIKEAHTEELIRYNPQIHYLDTDANHHINNRSYVNWCLEALPEDFMDAYKASLLDVKWGIQSYRHDKLEVIVKGKSKDELSQESPTLYFEIFRHNDDGTDDKVYDAYTKWKKRECFGI